MIDAIKLIVKSNAFIISLISLILYLIVYYKEVLIDGELISYLFYYFLGLLPIVLSVFAILISFTNKDFLKFLVDKPIVENSKMSIYDATIYYFKLNTYLIVFSLIVTCLTIVFALSDFKIFTFPILQYVLLFILVYTTVSFINVVRFIFYFARKKSEYLKEQN